MQGGASVSWDTVMIGLFILLREKRNAGKSDREPGNNVGKYQRGKDEDVTV